MRTLLLALLLFTAAPTLAQVDTLDVATLYASGTEYEAFLETADRRRAMWFENDRKETEVAEAAALVDATGSDWHLLVIAVSGCSDSANTIPYLSDLVRASDRLSMRVVAPHSATALMEAFRTPDGRTATPTVVVLNADRAVVGAWVERPAALQDIYLETGRTLSSADWLRDKFSWYDADAGVSTVNEVAALIGTQVGGR